MVSLIFLPVIGGRGQNQNLCWAYRKGEAEDVAKIYIIDGFFYC